ncbi:GH10791 [Drosophila grimshawi]|uniref:GH10791 n=1 Tax=Drosophila grimshawi TaxID=7222 RepID=B4JB88_DROGR|nr:GH10791 [Drosophila grimshawi]
MSKNSEAHLTPQLKEHYEMEAEILALLMEMEKRYRDYYEFYQCELESQKIIIERLWLLTQRYLILISSTPGCRYPEVYTLSAEEAIINEYEEKLEVMRGSNNDMKHAVLDLNIECKKFYEAYNQLDKNMETPLILGDKYHHSIEHHKEMVADIFNYLYSAILKMKCYMHQLDPISLESVEDYRELLKADSSNEEFEEFLMKKFVYCKCLQPRPTCPILKLKCAHGKIHNLNVYYK